MVIGHSGCPDKLSWFIYTFHMPLFFYLSGFFFKETNIQAPLNYVFKKIKGIWWPFQKWCLICLWLHNLFYYFGINSSYNSLFITLSNTFTCMIFMQGSDYLCSGTWFLHDLFVGSILLVFSTKIFHKCRLSFVASMFSSFLFFILLAAIFSYFDFVIAIKWIRILETRTLYATALIALGFLYKQKIQTLLANIDSIIMFLSTFICLILAIKFLPKTNINVDYITILLGIMLSLCGLAMVISLSKILSNIRPLSRLFVFIGEHTIIIFFMHTISFKLVSLLLIINGYFSWSDFSVISLRYGCSWIAYSIIGVIIPLIIYRFWIKCITPKFSLDRMILPYFDKIFVSIKNY